MDVMDYYYLGCDLVRAKDYDGAIEMFNKALEKEPDNNTILWARGGAYSKNGEKEKALADYTRMTELMPQNPDGWNCRGNLYHELKEYDKAIADYTKCILLSSPEYGMYWSNRGISYYEKGDLDAALADLTKSIETWRDADCTGWARFWRGLVWRKKGELDKALKDFVLADTYDPGNEDTYYQVGYIWFLREDYDMAIEWFSKAIEAKDHNADYWLARGICYWNKCVKEKSNFWDEDGETINLAENDFTKAIELAPDMADAYFNRGALRCSNARESNNLIKMIFAQKVTDDAKRILLLTQLEHMGGKYLVPKADAVLRRLRSNRDEVDVLMAKSFGLFAKDDAQEAVEDLTRALALEPERAAAYYQRGLAYTLLGERAKAISDYEQTCALNPDNEKASEKLNELLKSRRTE